MKVHFEKDNMSLGIAFRAFFGALFNRTTAERLRSALASQDSGAAERLSLPAQREGKRQLEAGDSPSHRGVAGVSRTGGTTSTTASKAESTRSEALTLLSALQREARLVDLICEPLDQFSDAQVGAAAREVLRDSRQTLERLFAITPLADQQEGETLSLAEQPSAARLRLLGKSTGSHGVVVHRGWIAGKCELPQWHGDRRDALVLMPTEVEVS